MPKIIQNIIYTVTSVVLSELFFTSFVFADTSVTYEVQIEPSLNISVSPSNISLDLNPLNKTFGTQDLLVSVGTNNPNGYKLYINADDDKLTNDDYANQKFYIETLESSVTSSSFPDNYWGYRISEGSTGDNNITDLTKNNFYPFISNTLISESTVATNKNTSTLTFASKINYEKPSGTYTLDLNFKALPIITTYTMQNLDPKVCTADPTLVTDSRDGQTYAIARLGDGKCWMVQNLRLGAKSETLELTKEDSNVDDDGFVLTNKLTTERFPYKTISKDPDTGGTTYYYDDPAYYCTSDYGCYYNSYTATAGSMTSEIGRNISVDYNICPTNWTLPTGGSGGDFEVLATAYGYRKDPGATVAGRLLVADPYVATENVNGQYTPGLVFGGGYYGGGADYIGIGASYWSRTSYSAGNAYRESIAESGVNPLNYHNKYIGFAVRCLFQES